MKILDLKKLFLIGSAIILTLLFAPLPAKASGFGTVEVHSRERLSGAHTKPINVKFRIDSDKNNRYKWVDSSGTCHGCDSESVVNNGRYGSAWTSSTGSDGMAKFGNGDSSGFACGTSKCPSSDAGTCNPFNLTLLGNWTDGSYWEVDFKYQGRIIDRGTLKGHNPVTHITIGNDANTYIVLTFHRAAKTTDSLSATLSANPTSLKFDKSAGETTNGATKNVTLTAAIYHSATPNHSSNNFTLVWDFGDGSPTQTTTTTSTTPSITHAYKWRDPSSAGPLTINPKVTVTCAGGKTATAQATITETTDIHYLSCSLTARPKSGTVPLVVDFDASLSMDSLGTVFPHGITRYIWNFDDGSPTQTTNIPTITYTYSISKSFSASVDVYNDNEPNLTHVSCPYVQPIDVSNWSESNQVEIAP